MVINHQDIDKLRKLIGELPAAKRTRFFEQYGLDTATVEMFVVNRALGNYYERAMSELGEWANVEDGDDNNTGSQETTMARLCANYLTSDVQGLLEGQGILRGKFQSGCGKFCRIY